MAGSAGVGSCTRRPSAANLRGALVEPGHRQREQRGCLLWRGGEVAQAICPGLEFHAAFHVDAPGFSVGAFG